jgi:hypothetical protein
MKKYSCFVADKDNFPGMPHELLAAWQDDNMAVYIIDFDVPDGLEDRLVRLIAQGLLWDDGWTECGTKSYIVEDLTPSTFNGSAEMMKDVKFGESLSNVRGSQPV